MCFIMYVLCKQRMIHPPPHPHPLQGATLLRSAPDKVHSGCLLPIAPQVHPGCHVTPKSANGRSPGWRGLPPFNRRIGSTESTKRLTLVSFLYFASKTTTLGEAGVSVSHTQGAEWITHRQRRDIVCVTYDARQMSRMQCCDSDAVPERFPLLASLKEGCRVGIVLFCFWVHFPPVYFCIIKPWNTLGTLIMHFWQAAFVSLSLWANVLCCGVSLLVASITTVPWRVEAEGGKKQHQHHRLKKSSV